MRELLQRILTETIKDYLQRTFTLENVLIFRDAVLDKIDESAEVTETQIDDYAVSIARTILNDENIARVYSWLVSRKWLFDENVCSASREQYGELAEQIRFECGGKVCCAIPSLIVVVQFLELIVPVLIEWYKAK